MSLILSGTDGLSDVDGSAATPAIRGTDSNTGIFFPAADTVGVSTGGSERVRVDSSGNVGIGSTPTAIGSYKVLEVNGTSGAYIALKQGGTEYGNIYNNSTDGTTISASGARNIILQTNAAERMRIDSSGNVGIGTTSPVAKLGIVGGTSNASSLATAYSLAAFNITPKSTSGYSLQFGSGPSDFPYIQMSAGGSAAGDLTIQPYGGNVLVGTPSALVTPSRIAIVFPGDTTWGIGFKSSYLTGSGQPCTFINSSNSVIGYIGTNGTATSYNTSSDYRLKHDIAPMTGALAKVSALKPVTYKWKSDDSECEGFIAHELAEVCPHAVTGEKDAVDENGNIKPQGIDTSFLVATLTAAIQEQQALIQSLTARITALETP